MRFSSVWRHNALDEIQYKPHGRRLQKHWIKTQASWLDYFFVMKKDTPRSIRPYDTRSRSAAIFFLEVSHIELFFRLKLGNDIFLRSSSSSSRSFNMLTNEKFNRNSTLYLQLIKISPQSSSTASHFYARNG